jgi:hypothetical protein
MGTIVIEQYGAVGTSANRDAPVYDINTLFVTTVDATTSTTAESVTLSNDTRLVRVIPTEAHRVAVGTDTTASKYAFLPAGTIYDTNVTPGSVFWYRSDV